MGLVCQRALGKNYPFSLLFESSKIVLVLLGLEVYKHSVLDLVYNKLLEGNTGRTQFTS